jgi:hypothetical protein
MVAIVRSLVENAGGRPGGEAFSLQRGLTPQITLQAFDPVEKPLPAACRKRAVAYSPSTTTADRNNQIPARVFVA